MYLFFCVICFTLYISFILLFFHTLARLSTRLLLCVLSFISFMYYSVTYLAYACDDGLPERIIRFFDDFVDAVGYWAECSETEDDCVISLASLNEQEDDLPF